MSLLRKEEWEETITFSSLRRSEMFIDVDRFDIVFAPLGAKCKREPNIALLTECRLLSDLSAINMSPLRSEEQEETISFICITAPPFGISCA